MKKTLVAAGVMLALSASLAAAEGINLSWNDCGLAGTSVSSFTCNSNSGVPFTLVASFVPPTQSVNRFLGVSAQVDFSTNTAALPDWWKHGTGQCRGSAALSTNFDFLSGPFTCFDPFGGQAAGGNLYEPGFSVPNRARMLVQCAIAAGTEIPLDSSTETYAFKVNITRTKTTGTGSCPGCTEPVCIVLNEIQLFQPLEENFDPKITMAADRNFATWQGASVPGCPLSTPTRNSSWGQVKSLYR